MPIAIIIIFIFTTVLCFLEHRFSYKDKQILYWTIATTLILFAGFREVGIDPDSANYEYAFYHYEDENIYSAMEYSFFLLSSILQHIISDVHIIFLFYALLGITLKFIAFRKFIDLWFLPIVVYLSFIYELHDITQIRTGVMSGFFLLAIKPIAERNWTQAILLLIIGSFFHISALILFPLLFLNNKDMTKRQRIMWSAIIPVSYMLHFTGNHLLFNLPIPYIENKLENYEKNSDFIESSLNVFSPLHIFTIFIFTYLLYFYDTIKTYNKYFPFMMKVFSLSIFSFTAFAFLPVLANRISYLLRIITIILFSNISYTIRPKYAGIITVIAIASIYIVYTYSYIFGIKIL